MRIKIPKDLTVFFDFDNTITTIDVIDDMLERFSETDGWRELEDQWQRGRIGSRECLKGQVEGIKIDRKSLDKYLAGIAIDPYFKRLLRLFESRGTPVIILSDNFDYMLESVLRRNDISGVEVYCNKIDISNGYLKTGFPYANSDCGGCANCKKEHVLARKKGATSVYIGDGRSDLCAARKSDIVFAKDYLKKVMRKEGRPHVAIGNLKDVYDYFQGSRKNRS